MNHPLLTVLVMLPLKLDKILDFTRFKQLGTVAFSSDPQMSCANNVWHMGKYKVK